jgi:tetrahydromethanopterin S-methyltransferase subunit G
MVFDIGFRRINTRLDFIDRKLDTIITYLQMIIQHLLGRRF